jgi:teichuronic acid biosynthesis glycosyltransferase TuaG
MPNQIRHNGISVVCPTYNSSAYIQRTVDCLLAQSMLPKEIIFSDDGSQDYTIQIIEKNRVSFEKLGIVLIVIQNYHGGPGAARNKGIKATDQVWIAFLDADDIWKKDKISIVQKSIKDYPDTNCFLHWEEYNRIDKGRSLMRHGDNYFQPNTPLLEQLYRRNFMSTSAIVCKNSLIKNVGGFDVTLPNAQDYDLWLKMATQMRLTIIPLVLGEYVEEPNSITSRPYHKRIWAEIRIAFRYKNQVSVILFINKMLKIILSIQWFYTLYNLLTGNQKHSA